MLILKFNLGPVELKNVPAADVAGFPTSFFTRWPANELLILRILRILINLLWFAHHFRSPSRPAPNCQVRPLAQSWEGKVAIKGRPTLGRQIWSSMAREQ